MKKSKKKYTPEEMLHFVYAFTSAFDPNAIPAFSVEASKTKNFYFFRIKTSNGDQYVLFPVSTYVENMGTIGAIERIFKTKHPRIMLRSQDITFDELVNEFGLDKYELAEAVFKHFKRTIDRFIKHASWTHHATMHFKTGPDNATWRLHANDDSLCKNLKKTSPVSSIDELIVWADLNQGT